MQSLYLIGYLRRSQAPPANSLEKRRDFFEGEIES